MPDQRPTTPSATAEDADVHAPETDAFEPIEEDGWADEPEELELPRRPRRRMLGAGGNPITLALLAALLIACGFIAGVHVEKGETSSGSAGATGAAGLAARFAALGGGSSSTSAHAGTGSTGSAAGGAAGGLPSAAGGASEPTSGTVAYVSANKLYVTNSEGNTVKVSTSASTSVTKTVKTKVLGIHPGETVTVTGATGSSGAVSATSISVGSSAGGFASLTGGAGTGAGSTTGKSAGTTALFGEG